MPIAECYPLSLEDSGAVWIEGDEYDPAEPIGFVETNGPDFPEYAEQWAYLLGEWRDARRFRRGCEGAAGLTGADLFTGGWL